MKLIVYVNLPVHFENIVNKVKKCPSHNQTYSLESKVIYCHYCGKELQVIESIDKDIVYYDVIYENESFKRKIVYNQIYLFNEVELDSEIIELNNEFIENEKAIFYEEHREDLIELDKIAGKKLQIKIGIYERT